MNKGLLLDRDGIINFDPGDYTTSLAEVRFNPGIFRFVKAAVDKAYKVIVITNQGGLAKGIYTIDAVHEIHQYMAKSFLERGVKIEEFFFCPHHDDFGKCLCRKPGSLLVEKAIAKYNLDPNQSIMIGDKQRDLDAAAKVGVKGFLSALNTDLNSQLSLPF